MTWTAAYPGQVAVCGWSRIPGTNTNAGTVVHYDALGNETWVAYHNSSVGTEIFRKVAIDHTGSVIATGAGLTAQADDTWSTIKLDSGGTLLWARLIDQAPCSSSSGYGYARAIFVAPARRSSSENRPRGKDCVAVPAKARFVVCALAADMTDTAATRRCSVAAVHGRTCSLGFSWRSSAYSTRSAPRAATSDHAGGTERTRTQRFTLTRTGRRWSGWAG